MFTALSDTSASSTPALLRLTEIRKIKAAHCNVFVFAGFATAVDGVRVTADDDGARSVCCAHDRPCHDPPGGHLGSWTHMRRVQR